MKYQTKALVVYDLEVYRNLFLCGLMTPDGIVTQFEDKESLLSALDHITHAGYELCGFNSGRYDDPVMSEFIRTDSTQAAYEASKDIIHGDVQPWSFDVTYGSVDLMPLLPGRMSLKQVGVRLKHKKLQELPIDWDKELTPAEKNIIRSYNINDLQITRKLLDEIQPELDLRGDLSRQYGMDLRSKGDAGIAEEVISLEGGALLSVIKSDLKKMAQENVADYPGVVVSAPDWWDSFAFGINSHTRSVVESQSRRFDRYIPLDHNGRLALPPLENLYLDDKYYKVGAGGLHSVDGPGCYENGPDEFIVDIDVTSYYPAIMLNNELFPRHIGTPFGVIFKRLVEQRLAAKRAGDKVTADRLKITINGTFGKTSDPYSALYDPQVTAGTTIIGQVSLLVLIAMLADYGLKTVSANTDGITVLGRNGQKPDLYAAVGAWENLTQFNMEYTYYESIYYRDVNNYIANVAGGKGEKQKTKGVFAVKPGVDLRHSLKGNVIAEAVKQYLGTYAPVAETIRGCTDINMFLLTHAATGNYKCSWWGTDLGKLVRFYKSTRMTACAIIKADSVKGVSSNVPQSENCVPLQDLPDAFPEDIDYGWYITAACDILASIKEPKQPGMNAAAEKIKHLRPCIISPSKLRSRAKTEYGTVDFNSMTSDQKLGVMTGKAAGLIAKVNAHTGETLDLYAFNGNLPTQVRINHREKTGINIIYGGAVEYPENCTTILTLEGDTLDGWKQNYTPGELKRAGEKDE